MFDWNDLRFFLEVARAGRLAPAARRLKVDHTTVSRHIADIERDLDRRLFDRHADGFTLTDAGHKLFDMAERIEQNMFAIEETITPTEAGSPCGTVRVASMEGIGAFFLAERFTNFVARYPSVKIELVTERHLINLTRREADISISFVPPQGPRLNVQKVGTFRLALFASSTYLARRGAPASRGELKDHDFVDYVDDLVAIEPVHWLLEVLRPANVSFRSTSMAAQQTAVAAGAGIALLPLFSAKTNPALIPILQTEIVVQRHFYLASHKDIEALPRIRAATRFLSELFSAEAAYLNEF